MIAEQTRASRSSQQIAALRHRDSLLPSEPALSPLVPQETPPNQDAMMAFYEWAAFSDEAIEARDAKRLMDSMGVAR